MSVFVDEYLPDEVPGYPCVSSPRWNTKIVTVDSGDEQVSERWANPLYRFTLPRAVREHATFAAVRDHWLALRGPACTFPFRDPLDFASAELDFPNQTPALASTNQQIGTGDGVTTSFQLVKNYTVGSQTYSRNIYLPVISSVLIAIDGLDPYPIGWDVTRDGGVVTFDTAPSPSAIITAGFLFDVEVRFESDEAFDGIVQAYTASGFADLTFVGKKRCRS